MKCPLCGAADLVRDTRDVPYTYKGETTVIPAVKADFCPACDESITDMAETDRVMREIQAFNKQANAAIVDPRIPFEVKAPNAITRKAIAELESGKGKRFSTVDDLMADLHADD